jgi:hypothetical protein
MPNPVPPVVIIKFTSGRSAIFTQLVGERFEMIVRENFFGDNVRANRSQQFDQLFAGLVFAFTTRACIARGDDYGCGLSGGSWQRSQYRLRQQVGSRNNAEMSAKPSANADGTDRLPLCGFKFGEERETTKRSRRQSSPCRP